MPEFTSEDLNEAHRALLSTLYFFTIDDKNKIVDVERIHYLNMKVLEFMDMQIPETEVI